MSTILATAKGFSGPTNSERSARIPTLDGWRGVAILLVLADHLQVAFLGHTIRPWTQTGLHGVTIFFVLSGFLITTKLLEGPQLRDFYLRRFCKLMPAAWLYLAWLLLFDRLSGAHITSRAEIVSCVLFYRNFLVAPGFAAHFWSLSIEEQFYLAWPILLLLLGVRRGLWLAFAGIASVALYRWAFWDRYNRTFADTHTQVWADALLVGCSLALLMAQPKVRIFAMRWSKVWTIPSLAIFLASIARFHRMAPLHESLAIASLIAASMLHPRSLLFRPLSTAVLIYLGLISYSLYLWQQFFVGLWLNHIAVIVSCFAFPICAVASYYLIERPGARWGHRLTQKRISATTSRGRSGNDDLKRLAARET
jgi:peptidoglycan/LPS O-acetylase OafA/YrhL